MTPSSARGAGALAAVIALTVAAALLGVAAVFAVPPGLPYDEPAHWSNVLFYAQHLRLPVLGEAGVLYEAQQTPLYYLASAAVVRMLGDRDAAFIAVRLFGVVGLVVMTALIAAILRRVAPALPVVVVTGTAFVALNPMLIVMSASVQNDTWALVAGFAAMLVAPADGARHPWWRGIAIGLLGAIGILVKISVAPLVLAIVVLLLCRRRFVEACASGAVVIAACGWWVVRNLLLYGDLTGQAGVDAAGFRFGRGGLGAVALVREVLTYLAVPTEYLRNTISSPPWLDIVVVLIGAAIIVGAATVVTRGRALLRPWSLWMVVIVGLASVAAWLLQVMLGWQVAFRTAYGALPLVALAFGASTLLVRGPRGRLVLGAVLAALVIATTVWTATAVLGTGHAPLLTP